MREIFVTTEQELTKAFAEHEAMIGHNPQWAGYGMRSWVCGRLGCEIVVKRRDA